jgi:hypothetical protein
MTVLDMKVQWSPEQAQEFAAAKRSVVILAERLKDDRLRHLLWPIRLAAENVAMDRRDSGGFITIDVEELDRIFFTMLEDGERVEERLGEVLRELL